MAKNWDTETAKTCRFPEFKADACETCRDKRYCKAHKRGLVQMSIWDILPEEEEQPLRDCGRHCDCALFSLNCYIKRGYVRVEGKWIRNEDGSIMIIGGECDWKPSEPWTRIDDDMTVAWWKSSLKEYKPNKFEPGCIDHIARGAINEKPAWIGIGTYVSGIGEEYTELVPKYYKLTNDFTKGE